MKFRAVAISLMIALAPLATTGTALAQEAVVAAQDKEALFTSSDPVLHANKQVVYNIIRELLEANHWDRAGLYLTDRYIQHNPNAASGLDAVINYFTNVLGVKPSPIPEKITMPVVFVTAEDDLVTVATVRELPDPADPSKTYTTTWYDTWRIVDGKADEHWDTATRE